MHVFGLDAYGVAELVHRLSAALVARGARVDLVLASPTRRFLDQVAPGVRVVELRPGWLFPLYLLAAAPIATLSMLRLYRCQRAPVFKSLCCLPTLVSYLRRERPDALLAAKTVSNLMALMAAKLARFPGRVVVSEHNRMHVLRDRNWLSLLPAMRRWYPRAACRVAVSNGLANEVSRVVRAEVTTIYSPAAQPGAGTVGDEASGHPYLEEGQPLVLAVGRLAPQKDFATLLRSFARVRQQRLARLAILGEGEQRVELQALAERLGVSESVAMPGFVADPHAYMARAGVFVLSSRFEGLGLVVVEALAVGCPVVSTDCPFGPAETLDDGAYGRLVPVGDDRALAEAIVATLDEEPPRERLKRRARLYSVERAADRYLEVLLGNR